MRRPTARLRTAVRNWLGITHQESDLIHLTLEVATGLTELRTQTEGVISTLENLAQQNAALAGALHRVVAQLNDNTTKIARWAQQSATLQEIERRHARQAGGSKILTLGVGD